MLNTPIIISSTCNIVANDSVSCSDKKSKCCKKYKKKGKSNCRRCPKL